MGFGPVPSQSGAQTALGNFLVSILPSGVGVFEGQDNRVSEPSNTDFVTMTTILRQRIETNVDTYADCAFTASIAGTVMTVTAVRLGALTIGNLMVGGLNVAAGTTIVSQTSGPAGGPGTYTVSQSQTVASEEMACGVENILQPTKVTIQLDVHSANVGNASDMAQTISTLFRDDYATIWFYRQGYAAQGIVPLYADDPKQIPFINAEQQYETRYVVEAVLQVNQVVTPPQQFADNVIVHTIEVDTTYTP
jgi:hypothetical protein